MNFRSTLTTGAMAFALLAVRSAAADQEQFLLDQYAPAPADLERWQTASLYADFAEAPEFIGRQLTDGERQVRAELEAVCTMQSFLDCQTFIGTNRQQVLRALPDDPVYWARFWRLFSTNIMPDLEPAESNPLIDRSRLIRSTYWWFFRDLADDGRVEVEHALTLQTGLRRWLSSPQTIISRMTTVALQQIAYDQISFAMAQASRDRDTEQLGALAEATRPFTSLEMSWGPLLWTAREVFLRHTDKAAPTQIHPDADEENWLFDVAQFTDGSAARLLVDDPAIFIKRDQDVLAAHYLPLSSAAWSEYWSQGIPPLAEDKFDVPSFAVLDVHAFSSYLATERAARFRMILFQPLVDIYTGRVSPGIPARPAPLHWRWEWRDGANARLCLASDSIHPSTKQDPDAATERWCIDYYDEAAAARLHTS